LKITHCVFNFEKLEVGYDLIAFSLLLPSIYTNPTSLVPYSTKKTSKNEHWGWALRCSLLTIGFKLENGLWLFVKIMRRKWRLCGHLLNLINIFRRNSRLKSFILTRMVCACCKWAGIGVQVGKACLCLGFILKPSVQGNFDWNGHRTRSYICDYTFSSSIQVEISPLKFGGTMVWVSAAKTLESSAPLVR
jgi:hypothetical protein